MVSEVGGFAKLKKVFRGNLCLSEMLDSMMNLSTGLTTKTKAERPIVYYCEGYTESSRTTP